MPSPSSELTIIVDATYTLSMGYGHVWKATVRRVVDGTLADREIKLALLDNLGGGRYGGRFHSLEPETAVTLHLRRAPSEPVGLQGFVAADGTVWELVGVEPR